MKKALIGLAMLPLLTAGMCAHSPEIVRVPIPVACAEEGDIPAEPPLVGDKLSGNAERDIGIVAASNIRLRSWGNELRAILTGCQNNEQSNQNQSQ